MRTEGGGHFGEGEGLGGGGRKTKGREIAEGPGGGVRATERATGRQKRGKVALCGEESRRNDVEVAPEGY